MTTTRTRIGSRLSWLCRASSGVFDAAWRAPDLPAAGTPADLFETKERRARVQAAILALPLEYREVIVLRELEELSYKEISAIVDIPIGTVMSRLARGRELLQKRMLFAHKRSRR